MKSKRLDPVPGWTGWRKITMFKTSASQDAFPNILDAESFFLMLRQQRNHNFYRLDNWHRWKTEQNTICSSEKLTRHGQTDISCLWLIPNVDWRSLKSIYLYFKWMWIITIRVGKWHPLIFVFDVAADCHLHVASSLHAEPPLGDLVPLSGAEWLEWGGDPPQTPRRCQAQPIRRHGLQQPDICQNSEFCAALDCRGSSGNTGAYKERLLQRENVNNAFEVADAAAFQLLRRRFLEDLHII